MKAKHFIPVLLLFAFIALLGNGNIFVSDVAAKIPGTNIVIDGKSNDWIWVPPLAFARNNCADYFPEEVGAAVTNRVDVKVVKAFIDTKKDIFYFYIKFWGGPVWPNFGYESEYDGQTVVRHRGYYHLLLDLDNDPTTGWDSRYYEGSYTPVGYYASQGLWNSRHLGAECYIDLEIDSDWTPPRGTGEVKYVSYGANDMHDYDGLTGTGGYNHMYYFDVVNPQFNDMDHYVGLTLGDDGEEHWAGHAFGYNFLEYGVSLDVFREYWTDMGHDYLKPGDVIGVSAFIETPIDGWGVDVSPRGYLIVLPPFLCKDITEDNLAKAVPTKFALKQNHPNPFNPQTAIGYSVEEETHVTLSVYNIAGELVSKLVDNSMSTGNHSVTWNGRDEFGRSVAGGVYLCRIQAGEFQQTIRMLLLK
jgi:hypothetical protein